MSTCKIKAINYWDDMDLKPLIDASLILYLTPDNTGAYNDKSGNMHTIVNNAGIMEPVDAKGLFGLNIRLPGNPAYLKALSSDTLNTITTGLTFSIWINKQANSTGSTTLLGRRSGPDTGDSFILVYGEPIENYVYAFGIRGSWAGSIRSSADDLNKWVEVTCTYDGQMMKIYFDGILESSASAPGIEIPWETTDLYIGCGDNGTFGLEEFTKCIVGSVLVYNRGLSAAEILSNHQKSPYYYLNQAI